MSASDTDLELLDAHLDGELPAEQAEELRVRLDVDPSLAAALEALRAERGVRQQAWRSMEPADDAAVDRFADRAIAATRSTSRRERFDFVLTKLKQVAAAAACVAIGFSVGWLGRGGDIGRMGSGTPTTVVEGPVADSGHRMVMSQPKAGGPVEITLTNTAGQVLATQTFDRPEDARQFIEDLDRWQQQQERLRDKQFIYTGGQF